MKGPFHSHVLRVQNVEMLTKVNNDIYSGCLVPLFSSLEAEQYGERILKIG